MRADPRCVDVTLDRWRWDQTYTPDAWRELLSTFSGPLSLPAADREVMVRDLADLAESTVGSVTRPLVITLATCRFALRSDHPIRDPA